MNALPKKNIAFRSIRSAGATLVALNTAILLKQMNPGQKVLFLQLTTVPDIQLLLDFEVKTTFADLLSFYRSQSEWSSEIFFETIVHHQVDILPAPTGRGAWDSLPPEFLEATLRMAKAEYDSVVIDMGDLPFSFYSHLLPELDHLVTVLNVDFISLQRHKTFLEDLKSFLPSLKKQSLLFNQFPASGEKLLKKWKKEVSLPVIGTLPVDRESVWYHMFQKKPCALQPESPFTQALREVIAHL